MDKKSFSKEIFASYGKYYDILYTDKNYEKECDFLEEIYRKYSETPPKEILDVGCGTGGHAIPLAKRGYRTTGIDSSEIMINLAKEKAKNAGVKVNFYKMDMTRLQLNRKFDACICMFAVIDYLTDNKTINISLSGIRKHLKDGSLFVFDFWYGPAVLSSLPSVKLKRVKKGSVKVIKFAEPHLDTLHHVCRVNYYVMVTRGCSILDEVEEEHVVRFFFPEEIKYHLEKCGFELLKLCSFPNLDVAPTEQTWNVAAISRAS